MVMSGLKSSKVTVISETNIGLYVWQMPNGQIVTDQNKDVMNIPAMRGDITAITKISNAAKKLGIDEGSPLFLEGARRVTEEELEEQTERMSSGLIPDPYDIGNYKDTLENDRAE